MNRPDCNSLFLSTFTIGILIWALYVPTFLSTTANTFDRVATLSCVAYTIACYIRARSVDAGSVLIFEAREVENVCLRCSGAAKPREAHHCSRCNTCVLRMDHHCPWLNNCVGVRNQRYFIQFLAGAALSAVFTGALCVSEFNRNCYIVPNTKCTHMSALMAGIWLGCFFLLFTSTLLFEQARNIASNTPRIDALNKRYGEPVGAWAALCKVMGPLGIAWVAPLETAYDVRFLRALSSGKRSVAESSQTKRVY
jgi:ribosomal protein L40E